MPSIHKKLSAEMLDNILKCVEGIYVIEEASREIVYVNEFICRQEPAQYIGKTCHKAFLGKDEPCDFCPDLREATGRNQSCYSWDFFDSRTGSWFKVKNRYFELDGVGYRAGNLNMMGDTMGLSRDAISEMSALQKLLNRNEQLQEDFEHEATHDRMTGMRNRNQYIRDLKNICGGALGVLYFDINNLKETNDGFNHAMGDSLIIRLATAIMVSLGDGIEGYRIGGDEFVVLYHNCDTDALASCRENIMELLEEANENQPVPCNIAVGSAFCQDTEDAEKLVAQADHEMYRDKAKKKGL